MNQSVVRCNILTEADIEAETNNFIVVENTLEDATGDESDRDEEDNGDEDGGEEVGENEDVDNKDFISKTGNLL